MMLCVRQKRGFLRYRKHSFHREICFVGASRWFCLYGGCFFLTAETRASGYPGRSSCTGVLAAADRVFLRMPGSCLHICARGAEGPEGRPQGGVWTADRQSGADPVRPQAARAREKKAGNPWSACKKSPHLTVKFYTTLFHLLPWKAQSCVRHPGKLLFFEVHRYCLQRSICRFSHRHELLRYNCC